MRKKNKGWLQNLAILLLSLSALLLLVLVFPLELQGRQGLDWLGTLFSRGDASPQQPVELTYAAAPLNLVLTNGYGRRGELLTTPLSDTAAACGSLVREAAGSSTDSVEVTPGDFQQALDEESLLMDFLFPLPAQVISTWFGCTFADDLPIRCLLLTTSQGDMCSLLLWDDDHAPRRYSTAIPNATLLDFLNGTDTNGASFAYEAGKGYDSLYPFTLLPAERITLPLLDVSVPADASTDARLLSLLDFNVHTNYRYTEVDGTQVIVESPRSLSIHPDGSIFYTGDSGTSAPLFNIPLERGEAPGAAEAALWSLNLAGTLLPPEFSGDAVFFLTAMEETEAGWHVSLGMSVDGIPVYFSDDADAAEIWFTGSTITSLSLRFRRYTVEEESYTLLPLAQAVAMVQDRRNALLTVGYVDRGSAAVSPAWLLH